MHLYILTLMKNETGPKMFVKKCFLKKLLRTLSLPVMLFTSSGRGDVVNDLDGKP